MIEIYIGSSEVEELTTENEFAILSGESQEHLGSVQNTLSRIFTNAILSAVEQSIPDRYIIDSAAISFKVSGGFAGTGLSGDVKVVIKPKS